MGFLEKIRTLSLASNHYSMSLFSQRPFSDRTASWLQQSGLHPLLARLYAARGIDKPVELSLDL
jgi:single-stranded-DNA-specific exonuclease